MKSKTFRSPFCTLQKVTMKTLLPYKLKVSTQIVTKDFVTLCPEYEVFEKIKSDKRDRVRTFKKIMLKSASDTMILNMIMKNKKFSNYITNQRKEIPKSSSSIVLHHQFNIPIKSKIKDTTFITNIKNIQKSENSIISLQAMGLTTDRIHNYKDLSDLKINKYLRAKKKFNVYITSSRSLSSQKPLTTSRVNGSSRTLRTYDKIEMLFQPSLGKLDDLRCLIRKNIRRENKNTEREVRHQRILNEMKDIEKCIDYKEDKKWYH